MVTAHSSNAIEQLVASPGVDTEVYAVKLMRRQTYLTPDQDRAVKRLAEKYDTSEAEIIRRALDHWLHLEGARENEDPFASLFGFVDGPASMDHDDIYR